MSDAIEKIAEIMFAILVVWISYRNIVQIIEIGDFKKEIKKLHFHLYEHHGIWLGDDDD